MYLTVTFNPSLDYHISVDTFHYAGLNRAKEENVVAGGKGINVSMVLHNLGKETRAYGFTGGFTGEALTGMVKKSGVDFVALPVSKGDTRINVKLKSGEETEINGRGPQLGEKELGRLQEQLQSDLQKEDVLILSGNVPSTLPKTVYRDLGTIATCKGAKLVVDAEGELLSSTLPLHPFLIKPNKEELSVLCGKTLETNEEILLASQELQQKGARNVLVSLGPEGALLLTETGEDYHSPAPQGPVQSTVGAGDSMVAAFLSSFAEYLDYPKALQCAIAAGSATAFAGSLCTKEQMEALQSAF